MTRNWKWWARVVGWLIACALLVWLNACPRLPLTW
jgi:hypothetical protein